MAKKEKQEKPAQKTKEFNAKPFQALKGLAIPKEGTGEEPAGKGSKAAPASKAAAKPAAAKKPAPPPEDLAEASLFYEAMEGVTRLDGKTPAPSPKGTAAPAPKPKVDAEEARVFLQAVEALRMDVRFTDEVPEEPVRPAPVNRMRQLRRGAIRVDLELDLHGLTRDEAIENLERFVKGAYNRGQKGVLVITGKGNNSEGEPVLKNAVSAWLRETGKSMVSEFVTAPREMGGGGAIVIFLKEKKS